MHIGKLENKDMLSYHQKGKVEALKAVRQKVSYLVEVLGKKLGDVILIVEDGSGSAFPVCTKQCISFDAASFDGFRTIKKDYSMLVRFEIID